MTADTELTDFQRYAVLFFLNTKTDFPIQQTNCNLCIAFSGIQGKIARYQGKNTYK